MNDDGHTDDLEKPYVLSETIIRIIEANHTYDLNESYVSSDQRIKGRFPDHSKMTEEPSPDLF